jgi:hypothetical protein
MRLLPTLTKDTANFDFEWAGENVQFSAYRHVLTVNFLSSLKNAENEPKQFAEMLTKIIATWNIEDVDCKDVEAIAEHIPMEFMKLLMDKVSSIWNGEKKSLEASASGSAA